MYIKTDGTKFVGKSDLWSSVDEARSHINKFINTLDDEKFANALEYKLGFGKHETDNVTRCLRSTLTRIITQDTVEGWISEILDVLVLFNGMQMLNRKSSSLEQFSKSFQLSSDIEAKRALGARSYWRGKQFICTSSSTLGLPAFLIYAVFVDRTEVAMYDAAYVLEHPVPNGLVFDLPPEGVSQMLSTLIKTICEDVQVEVSREDVPIRESNRITHVKRATGVRSYSAPPPKGNHSLAAFKYKVVVDNGRLEIYVRSLEELKELRRQLLSDEL